MKEVEHDTTAMQKQVLRTLLYFDIFNYPLKAKEVFRFLGQRHGGISNVQHELDHLANARQIFRFGEFYAMQDNAANIERREKGNAEAKRYLAIAHQKAKLIARFPFVRAVMASGSLSKGYMDENSDLDFFIVTEPGRLWIARMLLVLYKRIFLFNSHKLFCVNYFVDTDHLEIEEKNLFTATELATVIPLYGGELYQKLQADNAWMKKFFPNYISRSTEAVPATSPRRITRWLEKLINIFGGDFFERFFMRMTVRRWAKMYQQNYAEQDFKVAFKSKQYASKNHPRHYQKKITTLYHEKLHDYQQKFNLSEKL